MTAMAKRKNRDEAIRTVVETNRARLSRVVRSLVRDDDEADDILQDVFEEFIAVYDLGKTIEAAGAWLVRVARNKVIDRFRRKKSQAEYRLLIQQDEPAVEDTGDRMTARFQTELVRALESLPRDQREVFVKHELEGKSFEEIAGESGVGVNTLLTRKRRAVLALRRILKEVYDELEP